MENKKRKTTNKRKKNKNYRRHVVIQYIEGISARADQVLKKYAMLPHTTLICMLVHQKDKVKLEEQGDLV